MLVNCKNGVSSYEVARDLGLTQKSAWFVLHRLRLALQGKSPHQTRRQGKRSRSGRNFHWRKVPLHAQARPRTPTVLANGPTRTRLLVIGILERGGKVRAHRYSESQKEAVAIRSPKACRSWSRVCSLTLCCPTRDLVRGYAHKVIDHAVRYVDGKVHTNDLENFWSLLKRGIQGNLCER